MNIYSTLKINVHVCAYTSLIISLFINLGQNFTLNIRFKKSGIFFNAEHFVLYLFRNAKIT